MNELNEYDKILSNFVSHILFNTKLNYSVKEYIKAADDIGKVAFEEIRGQSEYYSRLINTMAKYIAEEGLLCEEIGTRKCSSFTDCKKCIISYFKEKMKDE